MSLNRIKLLTLLASLTLVASCGKTKDASSALHETDDSSEGGEGGGVSSSEGGSIGCKFLANLHGTPNPVDYARLVVKPSNENSSLDFYTSKESFEAEEDPIATSTCNKLNYNDYSNWNVKCDGGIVSSEFGDTSPTFEAKTLNGYLIGTAVFKLQDLGGSAASIVTDCRPGL